jgi:kynurenine formamidase
MAEAPSSSKCRKVYWMNPSQNLDSLPSYAELPVIKGAPPGSSWGLWGEGDKLGCLNLLTPERVASAQETIRSHEVFPLDAPQGQPHPPLFNRRAFEHVVTDVSVGHDEFLSHWYPQSSSQWDGFRHVKHPIHGFYNGVPDEEHGVNHWARQGIVGRGVVVDVGRWREHTGSPFDYRAPYAITPEDLASTLADQGTTVETGDILLIRTGWMTWYKSCSVETRSELASGGTNGFMNPGLRPGKDMAEFLWNLHPAAVAIDNPAVERWPRGYPLPANEVTALLADPARCEEVFLHFSLLPLLGLPLGELWDLDALADACNADDRFECMLVSSPMNLPGGVGSPANALAIR